MTSEAADLTEALRLASLGGDDERRLFFRVLLQSDVLIPIKPGFTSGSEPPLIGSNSFEQYGFLTVQHGEKLKLPVFSELSLLEAWSQERFARVEKPFSFLLSILPESVWLHLNPGQEFGKEISAWEMERLRQGSEAIDEIMSETAETNARHDIAVSSAVDEMPELRQRFTAILEVYAEVDEAFLVFVEDESEDEVPFPVLGIKHNILDAEKLKLLREEIQAASYDALPPDQSLSIVDDLGKPGCRFTPVFEEVNPFYIRQRESAAKGESLVERVGRLFRAKG